MFTGLRDSYALLTLIALLPGAISWWSGRRLARLVDDPALPELLAAHEKHNGWMLVIAMAVFGVIAPWTFFALAFPLIFAGLIAAAYPLRRVLYHETWSFWSYLCFYPRLIAGMFGFWIVLMAMPGLAALAGKWDWLAAGGLAGVLVLWSMHSVDLVRLCLRTRPIGEGEFLSRCRALADACGVPQPRFERIELGGGVIANALALPSLRTSSVLFTDTVLDGFDQQELLAICAHELAHFEHYNPAHLRRLRLVTYVLIAVGAVAAPLLRIAGLDAVSLPIVVGFGTFLIALAIQLRGRQRQETACDLRAVELTGDADALVRGLTKLYTIARIPRRIEQLTDRAATHPSLARRIRDIRKAAGAAPVALDGEHAFTSADGRTVVTFDDAEVRWVERDAVTHSLGYSDLTELRVEAKRGRGSRLVALGAGARRWDMLLAGPDVARLQAVLDVVDGRLADPPRPRTVPSVIQGVVILTAASMVLALSQIAVAFVALLALLKPSVPLLVGAGVAALTAAGLVLRDHPGVICATLMSLPLAVTGLLLLAFAWAHRHDARQGLRPYITLLGVLAALAVVALTMSGLNVVRLHLSARSMTSAIVLLGAFAGALACSKVRRVRLNGAAVGAVALVVAVAASPTFLYLVAADPFLVHGPPLDWVPVGSAAAAEFAVPPGTSRIDLSPNGRYVAAYREADDDDEAPTFQVGRTGETLTSVAADDVAFVDDNRLLVVEAGSGGVTLKVLGLGSSLDVIWQQFVEDVVVPSFSLDRATGGWRVMGRRDDRSFVRVEGVLGTSGVQRRRWPAEDTFGGYARAVTTAGSDMLVFETRYDSGPLARVIPWQWTWGLVQPFNPVSRFTAIGDGGRRRFGESMLDVDCMADVLPGDGLVCSVHDGTRTHIVRIAARTGNVEGIGWLDGRFYSDQNVVRGWLTGWAGAAGAVAIRLTTGEVLQLPDSAGAVSSLSVAGDRLAAVTLGDGHFTVRVYPLPPDTRTPETMRAQRSPY